MRQRFSSLVATVTVFAVAIASVQVLPAAAAPSAQTPPRSDCLVDLRAQVSPAVLLLGETADVTLRASARCAMSAPLHLVLVLGEPATMAGEPIVQLKTATKVIISSLDLTSNPSTSVGLVAFQSTARTFCALTNDEARLMACAGKLDARGGRAIDRGITEGLKVLADGRNGPGDGVAPNEVMMVVADGANEAGCDPVMSAARRAKGQGVLVVAVNIGAGDMQCMVACASSARYAFLIENAGQLVNVFAKLRESLAPAALRRLTIVETLPANMAYIDGSANPPADVSGDKKTLTWEYQNVSEAGVTLSYAIRPLAPGYRAVSLGAWADFADPRGLLGRAAFPIPHVSVFGQSAGPPLIERIAPLGEIQAAEWADLGGR
ncbi:MAG TPA: VWA domain-containing protein [Anaerolineae bacterium]|nr:VWA domain-containing protein [Anaerolineae bacterium]